MLTDDELKAFLESLPPKKEEVEQVIYKIENHIVLSPYDLIVMIKLRYFGLLIRKYKEKE